MRQKLKDFTIIIPLHLPLEYHSDYVSQTAKILAKNNKVVLFDFRYPYSWKELLFKTGLRKYLSSLVNLYQNKHQTIYFRPISILPFQKYDRICQLNKYLGILQLKLLAQTITNKIIVWGFDPAMNDTVTIFNRAFCCYDCVDYQDVGLTEKYLTNEAWLLKKINAVAFNSQSLYHQKLKQTPSVANKSIVAVCGCDYELFQLKKRSSKIFNIDKKNKKIAVLAGSLDQRLDFELLDDVITKRQDYIFVIGGPVDYKIKNKFSRLQKYKNVIYLGKITKKELADIYYAADVGIIPYDATSKFVKHCNPMKAYEYLASGIPVVSTKILALENYPKDIVFTANSHEEFISGLKKITLRWDNAKRNQAKIIARKNSWQNKISIIEEFILKNNNWSSRKRPSVI